MLNFAIEENTIRIIGLEGIQISPNEDLHHEIAAITQKDDSLTKIVIAAKSNKSSQLRSKVQDWMFQNGLIYYKGKVYVPHDTELCRRIIELYHKSPLTGHPGRRKTKEIIQREYWWPGMTVFIYNYVDGCATCQSTKTITNPICIPTMPIEIKTSQTLFGLITTDFITDLPISQGYDSIMVVVCKNVIKACVFIPIKKTITAEETAEEYIKHVFKCFGMMEAMISNRGPQFAARFTQELCKKLDIKQIMSSAYHPQINRETERVNQELELFL